MIAIFDTSDHGKIEVNTDTNIVYFHRDDVERELTTKDSEPNLFHFSDMWGRSFVMVRASFTKVQDGKLYAEDLTYTLREIRPVTIAMIIKDGRQIYP